MDLRHWPYAVVMGVVSALFSVSYHVRGVSCGPGCWGGTNFQGFPFEWWSYSAGDVIYGNEIFGGHVTSWTGLIGNVSFWVIASLFIVYAIRELKTRIAIENKSLAMRTSFAIVQAVCVLVTAFLLMAISFFFSLLFLAWAIFYKMHRIK